MFNIKIIKEKKFKKICSSKDKAIKKYRNIIKKLKESLKEQRSKLFVQYYDELKKQKTECRDLIVKSLKTTVISMQKYMKEEDIYSALSAIDEGGFIELKVVEKLIPCDFYGEYYYEDNMGYFEDMDGYQFIKYYEIYAFSDREYEIVDNTSCERMVSYTDYSGNPKYLAYKKECHRLTIPKILEEYPKKSVQVLNQLVIQNSK